MKRTARAVVSAIALTSGFVAGCDDPANSTYSVPKFPGVSFARYPQGTAFGRYSSTGQGVSSKLDCVFEEDILSVEPSASPNLTKNQVLALIGLLREDYASVKNIDLVLDRAAIDTDVVKGISQIANLSCLDLSTAPLSESEVKVLLKIDSLQYLRVRRRNFTDNSLTTLLEESNAKVIVVD